MTLKVKHREPNAQVLPRRKRRGSGNFLSSHRDSRSVCETFCLSRVARLADIVLTTARHRHEYGLAQIVVQRSRATRRRLVTSFHRIFADLKSLFKCETSAIHESVSLKG
jgi:hypothetical protein